MKDGGKEERFATIMTIADLLIDKGSWCGETHIQKAMYIFDEFSDEKTGYDFILYKHGPFSFDLRSDLNQMQASNLLALASRHENYGPTIFTTKFGELIKRRNNDALKNKLGTLQFVVDWVGRYDVKALEKLATALFVIAEKPTANAGARAEALHEYKPHVTLDEAERAIGEAEARLSEFRQKQLKLKRAMHVVPQKQPN